MSPETQMIITSALHLTQQSEKVGISLMPDILPSRKSYFKTSNKPTSNTNLTYIKQNFERHSI